MAGATSLQGDFFRSVAFRYFHPDDVISGEGTRLHGGRFVPVGVRAVYASLEEETALREVTSRKSALGGRSEISVGEYDRINPRRHGELACGVLRLSPWDLQIAVLHVDPLRV